MRSKMVCKSRAAWRIYIGFGWLPSLYKVFVDLIISSRTRSAFLLSQVRQGKKLKYIEHHTALIGFGFSVMRLGSCMRHYYPMHGDIPNMDLLERL